MRIGLHALGIGPGARREIIDAVATAAEAEGYGTLWAGEHIVLVDHGVSRYPYSADGQIAVPAGADWLDPLIALSFAAAATSTIRLATGVLLIPEHQPVALAKRTASLDRLSGGRFSLGIGVGWSREEFDALGIPFERRGARADEYIAAMREIWSQDPVSFAGAFVSFRDIRVNPKPVRSRIPVIVGGNSEAALRRAAQLGDGWYGFNLTGVPHVRDRVLLLRTMCESNGRDPSQLQIAVALDHAPTRDEHDALSEIGVDELVLVDAPPEQPEQVSEWLATLRPTP
jgi:probable F420-dependent oxidoreductase